MINQISNNFIPNTKNTRAKGSLKNQPLNHTYKADNVSFSGLHSKESKALFVFDLDGTFAHGTDNDIQELLETKKQTNAVLVYATGNSLKEFIKLQTKSQDKGINLPTPKYFIANNGQFIYENNDGELVEDLNWRAEIKEKTGFDKTKVYTAMKNIAHKPEYLFKDRDLDKLKKLEDLELRKQEDPNFWDSKISYYEWNTSDHLLEYFVSSDVDIKKLQKTIKNELGSEGIKTKFVLNKFPKKIMDMCSEKLTRQSQPLRETSEGAMVALFVCPADKADGIEYIKTKTQIPYSEIVMAGNESNDISMANLTKKGAFFICVANATNMLKDFISKIKGQADNKYPNNTIFAKKEGAPGILEGIRSILSSN